MSENNENLNKFRFISVKNTENESLQYIEKFSRAGYIYYGEDNLYPNYLINLLNTCPKHNAIIKRKSMMIGGNGWNTNNIDPIAATFLSNPYNELNLNEIAFRVSYDLEVYGAFAIEIIYSKDKTKISEINYIPVDKIRLSDDNESAFFSNDWSNIRKYPPVKYPLYNPKNKTSNQILYFKEYRPGIGFYGQPEYISAINWIELEYHVSTFHLNQVKNGFMPQMIINLTQGVPSEDQMSETISNLKKDYAGAKGEPVMFLFSDGPNNAAIITPLTLSDSDEKFIELNKEITQGIFVGHSVTNPGLFGVATEGELGQKNIILESLEIFQSMYITPKQKLIEDIFNKLLKINNSQSYLELNKYELDISKIEEGSNDK